MYDQSETNRTAVLKQIRQVEQNNDTDAIVSTRATQILKDKNHFDRLQTQVQKKQK